MSFKQISEKKTPTLPTWKIMSRIPLFKVILVTCLCVLFCSDSAIGEDYDDDNRNHKKSSSKDK